MSRFEIHLGDCLETLRTMPDSSVDSIVTDPPYGLSFMGKKWDYDVPATEVWAECLRVLKPGGHLLAFAGTRTQHRMAVRIEDAGFEIRDMIAWVYGCLSEDSEVLTEDGWMPYNRAKQKNILAYDLQNDIYQWEKPSRWNEYRVESDTAYRIQSDHTDQIVSRNHRCIVERGGVLEFVPAEELAGVERVPYLQSDFSALSQGRSELLLQAVLREGEGLAQAALSERQGEEAAGQGACWGEKPGMEGRADLLQAQGQIPGSVDQVRPLPCGTDEHGPQRRVSDGASACGCSGDRKGADAAGVRTPHQPRCNGQQAGEPDAVCNQCGSQAVRARASYQTTVATVTAIEYSGMIWCPTVSTGAFVARRNGKVFITGNSGFPKSLDVSKAIDKAAGRIESGESVAALKKTLIDLFDASGKTRKAIDEECGFRACNYLTLPADGKRPDPWVNVLPSQEKWATIKSVLGCDEDISARLDALFSEAEREVIGQVTKARSTSGASALPTMGGETVYHSWDITAPATEAARQWQGWGTALKPALEPITVARKPLIGTVAANVLQHGTGALNIDGCRVGDFQNTTPSGVDRRNAALAEAGYRPGTYQMGEKTPDTPPGRWPANLIHCGSEPADLLGEAARFFQQCKSGYNEAWHDLNLPQENANTAEQSLPQQRQAAVSALVLAVNSALPEGLLCSGLSTAPSTTATGIELRQIADIVTQTIQSIDLRFWHESKPARLTLSLNHASDAEIQRLTDTTTITVSRWKSDGSVDPVTFSITQQNLEVGERDCAPSTDGKRFIYCAKASKRDRDEGLEGFEAKAAKSYEGGRIVSADHPETAMGGASVRANTHPTVKPTDLMAYLCRLVTPPGGVVLDPFMGSGSTGKAAMREGFRFIGCEMSPEYLEIARARIESALKVL